MKVGWKQRLRNNRVNLEIQERAKKQLESLERSELELDDNLFLHDSKQYEGKYKMKN